MSDWNKLFVCIQDNGALEKLENDQNNIVLLQPGDIASVYIHVQDGEPVRLVLNLNGNPPTGQFPQPGE